MSHTFNVSLHGKRIVRTTDDEEKKKSENEMIAIALTIHIYAVRDLLPRSILY